MINFKKLFETVYEPRSGDEKNFKDKHVIMKIKYPVDTESQFTSDKPKAKRKADYDTKDDEAVYEAAEVHTKRADKEPVIVRTIDPKTGQGKAKTVLKRAGEIKVEEADLDEAVNADDYSTHGVKSQFGGYRAEIKHKTKGHTMYSGGHTYETAAKAKGEADAYLKGYSAPGGMGNDRHAESLARKHAASHATKGPFAKKTVKEDLDEKVVNPYAVGMAAAMKATGDRPPLKKSTIMKGHEIAKSIKKEAMDPVGKEDGDIDNDGDVDKSDKYLKNRRKAIGRAMQKEDASSDQENSSYTIYKKSNKPNPIKKNAEDAVKEAVELDELDKKTLGSYIKKASQSRGVAGIVAGSAVHKSKDQKDALKVMKNRMTGISRATDRLTKEEVDQLDELSPNTLHKYIKKATPEVAARAISAVAPNQSAETKKHASKLGKRIAGITSASGRLSDKANAMHEETYLDEAFKVGSMKLHDGSAVTLTRESVDALNGLFNQLNGSNKAKMEERMMSGKKGFQEILSFAENI